MVAAGIEIELDLGPPLECCHDLRPRLRRREAVELGYTEADFGKAMGYYQRFDANQSIKDAADALKVLRARPECKGKVGALGFCLGGKLAYNVNLPSFDPTVGLSAVNPTIQSIYQSVFDPYIGQAADLSFKPGLLTKWGWNEDRTKITLELRKGATWHDGSPVTPDDVVWSLTRAADPKGGNPICTSTEA